MKVSLQKALSFYLTGSTKEPNRMNSSFESNQFTQEELDDFETTQKEYEESRINGFKFDSPALNLEANLNSVTGQFRFAGMGVINSLFSGIGAFVASKINFISGLGLTALSFGASFIKDAPFLSTKFSIFTLGANSIRGSMHILDSIFSRIGEEGSKYNLPSLLAGGASLFSAFRSVNNKDNKSLELPNDTISGILGRTSIHHLDSMLASKATEISTQNHEAGAFLASSLSMLGFLVPKNLRIHRMPWNTLEGFMAQGGSKFIDSLFASIGNAFSGALNSTKKIALGTLGVTAGMPLLGSLLNTMNYQIPFGSLEGRIVKGILNVPETIAFNLGDTLGNSFLGIPISLGFAALTYFTCISKKGGNLINDIKISSTSLGGEFQKLPLMHLMYSTISKSAMKISNLIPAPLLVLFGPAMSFQIGEKFKNVSARWDSLHGLMLRNSVHLWDSVLSRGAYKTAMMMFGGANEESYSGNFISDAGGTAWLTEDGRKVSSMAIGKQLHQEKEANLSNILFSALGGAAFTFGAFNISKLFMKGGNNGTKVQMSIMSPSYKAVSKGLRPQALTFINRQEENVFCELALT